MPSVGFSLPRSQGCRDHRRGIHTVLEQWEKKISPHLVTVFGFVVVLFMVAMLVQDLFQTIKNVFLFRA